MFPLFGESDHSQSSKVVVCNFSVRVFKTFSEAFLENIQGAELKGCLTSLTQKELASSSASFEGGEAKEEDECMANEHKSVTHSAV